MGFSVVGGTTGAIQEVETATLAARVTGRPMDPGSLGAYAIHIDNGTTVMTAGLAANSPIVAFRWGNSNLCVLRSIRMAAVSVVAFTTLRMDFAAFFARSFSVSDTGGTTATLTTHNAKKRTSFGTTLLTELRFSQTATLTAGTRTLDATPFGRIEFNSTVAATNIVPNATPLWLRDTSDEYPIVFAQNEGFVIQATVAGTGTWHYSVQIEWAEMAAF